MRPLLTLALLTGCTEDGVFDDDFDQGPHELEEVLTGLPEGEFTERTRLAHAGEIRWTPGGEPWGDGGVGLGSATLTVVDAGPMVGVVFTSAGVQLRGYLERGDLQPVTWGIARGTARDDAPELTGAWWPAGTPVDALDELDGRVLAEAETDLLEIRSWIEEADIDEVYDVELSAPLVDTFGGGVALGGGAEILDAPAGEPLAWVREDLGLIWVEAVDDADGDWLPVRVADEGFEVVGWVHLDDVNESWGRVGGLGSAWGCGFSGFPYLGDGWLPAETWLYDTERGEIVGRTVRDLPFEGDPDGWTRLSRDTWWGPVELWIAPGDAVMAPRASFDH